jgi:hypothetical protein
VPLRSGVHAKRADELSEHKGEIKMPELDKESSRGEWVTKLLIEVTPGVREASWVSERKNRLEIAARNASCVSEILQHADA